VYTDWLALISCAAFSPTVYTQVQENLLLPFSNSPPTSVKWIWPGMSSPLLRYHDENIRHARPPVLHSFPGKLCRPLHIRVARCVAQCRWTPKAVQSAQIGPTPDIWKESWLAIIIAMFVHSAPKLVSSYYFGFRNNMTNDHCYRKSICYLLFGCEFCIPPLNRGSNPSGSEVFDTRPERPRDPHNLLYLRYRLSSCEWSGIGFPPSSSAEFDYW